MSENKKSFGQTLKTFSPNFWVASFLQLMERWGFYGVFTLLPLYLVASTDQGGLGLSHTEKGSIIGNVTAIQYFLPLVFGVIAELATCFYFWGNCRPYRLQTLFGHFLYYNGDRLLPNG